MRISKLTLTLTASVNDMISRYDTDKPKSKSVVSCILVYNDKTNHYVSAQCASFVFVCAYIYVIIQSLSFCANSHFDRLHIYQQTGHYTTENDTCLLTFLRKDITFNLHAISLDTDKTDPLGGVLYRGPHYMQQILP